MGYREFAPPTELTDLVESAWAVDGPPAAVRVLPDGCMDLISMDDRIVVAGPDTAASVAERDGDPYVGLRFRPGILPRLLGIPAVELRNRRVALSDLRRLPPRAHSLTEMTTHLAAEAPRGETAPWTLPQLRHVTDSLAAGSTVADLAGVHGWSPRTVQRHSTAVYGYGAATLRRVLRFRHARRLLDAGLPFTEVAARAGYADQPHLHREVRTLAGVPLAWFRQDASGANRSTQLPSGSATVA
ncbi:helix-turn-helix domain-containing protein [Mycobacterium sp. 2YAF39]|uniref:helix-turn-helix domain-containing protein n=1 Tax=Mycobacterium sp. 2YAF39 TaxID=3233033 RepID=UPI003F944323